MDLIGKDCEHLIYKYKHELEYSEIMEELKSDLQICGDDLIWYSSGICVSLDSSEEEKEYYKNRINVVREMNRRCIFDGKITYKDEHTIHLIEEILRGYKVIK